MYIATEKILYKQYKMILNDSLIYDQNEEKQIAKIKKELHEMGYYSDAYPLVIDDEFYRYDGEFDQLLKNWHNYLRFDAEHGRKHAIDKAFLILYLKQFFRFKEEIDDYDIFLRGCTKLLKNVQIVSGNKILQCLKSNMEYILKSEDNNKNSLQICAVGNLQDGSSQMAYQFNEINTLFDHKWIVTKLTDISADEIKPAIVFVEDAFCTAKQLLSIFETYMGIPLKERQTQEIHVDELNDQMKCKLRESRLYFSFIFYNSKNKDWFLNRLHEIGLPNVQIVSSDEFPKGCFETSDALDDDELPVVKRYFEEAGKMLINCKAYSNGKQKENWPTERIQTSYLGYDDSQQLIVFPWNTPTYTLTALWLSSDDSDCEWYPLFQRIDK